MIMAKFRRRKHFIDKSLQTKYLVLTILMLLIYTFLFVVILIFPYVVPLSADYPIEEQAKAARMLLALNKSIWPALGTVIVSMSVVSVFITHKIAGPVYRFKQVLGEVASGNLDISIKLRGHDDLKELAEDLNGTIGELRRLTQALRGGRETFSSFIDELNEQVKNNQISNEVGNELIGKIQTGKK